MSVFRALLSLAGSSLLLGHAALAQGKAWLVDNDLGHGTPDFAQIQPAVDAAADGDLIMVGSGTYGGFTIDGKNLTIEIFPGDVVGFTTTPAQTIVIKNLAATETVTLRNLGNAASRPYLSASSNLGPVFLETCETWGCTLADCAAISLQRSKVFLGTSLDHSTLYAYESTLAPAAFASGLAAANQSFAFLSGCAVSGSAGSEAQVTWDCICLTTFGPCDSLCGDPFPFVNCTSGTAPKPALTLATQSHVIALDSTFSGGAGGSSCGFGGATSPYPPAPGVAFDATSDITYLAGQNHRFSVTALAFEGGTINLFSKGVPGEHVFLVASGALAPSYLGALNGPLLVAQPWIVVFLGAVPASGQFSFPIQLNPNTVSGASFTQIYAQALFVNPSQQGPDYLGSASTLIVLDSAWHP